VPSGQVHLAQCLLWHVELGVLRAGGIYVPAVQQGGVTTVLILTVSISAEIWRNRYTQANTVRSSTLVRWQQCRGSSGSKQLHGPQQGSSQP
jgi:hypothetical protein